MAYTFGARLDDDSYALTTVDEDQGTATTKGEINGVPFEGGGGGSSDFSTAQVTIVNNLANQNVEVIVAHITVDEDGLTYLTYANRQSTITIDVALYKGVSFGALGQIISENVEITATGGIEMDETDFMVTSNGTITISE